MATIKTQIVNGVARILTKTTGGIRRVSCSCCAQEGCCMYPADQFGVLFGMDDLPEELIFNLYVGTNLFGTYTAIKNATANGIYWWDLGGGDSRAIRHEGEQWVLYAAEFPNEQPPSTNLGGQRCLIDDPEFNILPVFEDNFSDIYTVTPSNLDPIYGDGTLMYRRNLCNWDYPFVGESAPQLRATFFYHNGESTIYGQEATHGWYIDWGQEIFARKNNPQNSPEGIYDLGFVSYTVSE